MPYVRKCGGIFKTSTQRTQETKKDSIRKAMHEINNIEAMAVIVQDYPTTTESIAPFLKLYERTKADATFWADQAVTLNEKTAAASKTPDEVEYYFNYESLAESFQEVAEMMRHVSRGARISPPMRPKQGSDSPLASEDSSGSVTPQSEDLTYTPSNSTIERRQSTESIQTVFRSTSTDDL